MVKIIILFSLKIVVIILIVFPLSATAVIYNVLSFGAEPDNGTDSTEAFLQAWYLACSSIAPVVMWIPSGTYLVHPIDFSGPCESAGVTVQIDDINGLTINGGILDARGSQFWDCKRSGAFCPEGATSLSFNNVENATVSGIVSVDSQRAHIAINDCKSLLITNVTLIAPRQSPNTDGIDIQSSTGIEIIDSSIRTGDDCIAIGPGTNNLLVQGVACGPGHGIRCVDIMFRIMHSVKHM
ncbi:hypothetical protein MKX03_032929, partial [Papaver bracteatum]